MANIGSKIVLEGQKEYRNAISEANRDTRLLGSELRKLAKEFDGSANSTEALTRKNEVLKKQYEEQEKRIKLLRGALEDAEKVYGKNSTQVKNWQIQLNNAEGKLFDLDKELKNNEKYLNESKKSVDGTAKSIDEFGKEVKETEGQISVFGEVLKANLASELIIAGVNKIKDGVKALASHSIQVGTDFSSAMSSVAATMGMTAEEIANGKKEFVLLSDAAKDMGAKTEFSATQAGNALESLALAGYDAEKAVATLPAVLDLATAGGLDLARSATLITDSMSAMGIGAEQLDEHLDKIAKTAQSSNTNVAQLGEGILASAGMARSAGQNLTTLNTALGILANNGLKGAEGGTKLRNVLQSLTSPTDKARETLDRLGISASDSDGNFRQLDDILFDLNGELSKMSQEDRAKLITKIFNKTDISAVNALLGSMSGEFEDLKTKIDNANGTAKDMAKTMRDNLAGDMKGLESVTEAIGITIFEKFEKPLRQATQAGTKGLSDLNEELTKGQLGRNVDRLSENFGELAEKAIDLGLKTLPKVVDGLNWLVENGDFIVSVVGGIATGMLAFKVGGAIEKGIIAINGAWKLYKARAEGASVAQGILNVVLNASPIGLIATGVGIAAGALLLYKTRVKSASEETDVYSVSMENATKNAKSMAKRLDESNKNLDDTEKKMLTNATVAKNLANDIFELSKNEKLSNDEKFKMQTLVKNLNELVPDLNLAFDNQTNSLSMQRSEVDALVDSYMEMARVEAVAEAVKEMYKELYEAEAALQDLRDTDPGKSYSWSLPTAWLTGEDFTYTSQKIKDWNKSYGEISTQIYETENKIKKATKTVSESIVKTSSDTENLSKTTKTELGKTASVTEKATLAMIEAQEEYQKTLDKTADDIYRSSGIFDEFAKGTEISGKKLLKNLQGQVEGMGKWAENLQILSKKGIEDGLLAELYAMGPKAHGEISALVKMTDKELVKYNKAWEEKTELSRKIALEQLGEQKIEMAKKTNEITKDMKLSGGKGVVAYAKGIDNESKAIDTVLNSVKKTTNDKAKNLLYQAGQESASGFGRGLENKMKDVSVTVSTAMAKIANRAKEVLKIKSPSKVFEEIGKFTGEGFEIGFNKSMQKVNNEFDIPIIANSNFETNKGSSETKVINDFFANLKLTTQTQTPIFVGTEELGRILTDIQLSNDERFNPASSLI